MEPYSLFIGRFQPFHLGHLQDIKDIISNGEKVLIALGSADKYRQDQNPLTVAERKKLITETLAAEGITNDQYKLASINDIGEDNKWVQHCIDNLPKFNKVYTGSEHVSSLFITDGRIPVIPINFLDGITATDIRADIRNQSKNWHQKVHPKTKAVLDTKLF